METPSLRLSPCCFFLIPRRPQEFNNGCLCSLIKGRTPTASSIKCSTRSMKRMRSNKSWPCKTKKFTNRTYSKLNGKQCLSPLLEVQFQIPLWLMTHNRLLRMLTIQAWIVFPNNLQVETISNKLRHWLKNNLRRPCQQRQINLNNR